MSWHAGGRLELPEAIVARRRTAGRDALGAADVAAVADADWSAIAAGLDSDGFAVLGNLLTLAQCRQIAELYDDEARFRSRIVMARHGFGQGEYKYFDYPLPAPVGTLRAALYARLAPIANRWCERMRLEVRFPPTHAEFLAICHAAGQPRPTPLLLRYGPGDYNCLHQDLYGATVFPIQVAVLLSDPGGDFEGGEFMLVEQRPRMQSRGAVVPLGRGDAVIFGVSERPVAGSKGDYRVRMRHGVSRVRTGRRHTLGIIFHDAT